MAEGTCVDYGATLNPIGFCRPNTPEESRAQRVGLHQKRDRLCEPCWKAAYKEMFGEEWVDRP